MGKLIESYNDIISRVKSINDRIRQIESEIQQKSNDATSDNAARIIKLEEQLVKIDDYLLKVKGFQELAKKNLDSQNVLTIEAPPGYRVNLNRLSDWAKMIDPMSSNDPYAQRVFAVAKCDECFLEQKKQEFTERIAQLKSDQNTGKNEEIDRLKQSLELAREELKQFATSAEMSEFSQIVISENNKYWSKTSPTSFVNHEELDDVFSPGAYAASLNFAKEQRIWLKSFMGDYYDADGGRVLLPVEISNKQEYVMTITCAPAKRKNLDKALQNLILSSLNASPAGMRKICILDGVRFNASSVGSLKQLEDSFAMDRIPRNPDQLTSSLEQIVSSFADADEMIEQYDSLSEYNEKAEPAKRLPYKTIILFGWPTAFEGHDRELVQRIMTNYERYGVSIITVSYRNSEKKEDSENKDMPEYALQNAIHISRLQNESTITSADGKPQQFTWYSFADELSKSYVDSLLSNKVGKEKIGNEYIKRYPMTEMPSYIREYKRIELPFGIDGKDESHSLSFEDENFATYLVGASRSGKSTLLHTLITSLIMNYHPDNVELWLADFKQVEFKQYIENCPPHVKYILLDESTELVYDLIDKLTEKLMERQHIFAVNHIEKLVELKDTSKLKEPLPVIFVILDEFSIMSQKIADSQEYRLKLQNLLAKGAAMGIRFLFASQSFKTGISGLTPTAKAQIQQRIAMKADREEISETLELSANLKTEQVKNWMDALPPHYALVKFRINADTLPEVKRFYVLYFKDYSPRDNMIKQINDNMHCSEVYNYSDITSYVDKHRVLVDGNSFDAFPNAEFERLLNNTIKTVDNAGDVSVMFGTPRLMENIRTITFTQETRENMLLLCRNSEQACGASVITSIMKCFLKQGKKISVWAYEKNAVYKKYKNTAWNNEEFRNVNWSVGIDQVCEAIEMLKNRISNKEIDDSLIIMLGMDRIYSDFEFLEGASISGSSAQIIDEMVREQNNELLRKGAIASTEEEKAKAAQVNKWAVMMMNRRNQLKKEGKTDQEIKEILAKEREDFFKSEELPKVSTTENTMDVIKDNKDTNKMLKAAENFQYIVKFGSRFGYHFAVMLNDLSDIKSAGLNLSWFRHRMAFQISSDDSRDVFGSRIADSLPTHICQYSDSLTSYSVRPYLHNGIEWDSWTVDEDGKVINPY